MEALRVYWRPGCSSCVKVKEFLSQLGVDYESVNVSAQPEAMDELHALGVRTVPVVTRGRDYVFAQALEDVSRFVGKEVRIERLPEEVLMRKWLNVLEAAQRHVLQLPQQRLGELATEGRNRSIRDLAYHIYQIPDAFLQAIEDGVSDLTSIYNAEPPAEVRTAQDIRDYGARVTGRLRRWAAASLQAARGRTVNTYYGERPLHELLERSTWHSAQHARQIIVVLERFGIAPEGAITSEDYAGLPMPVGVWE